MKNTNLILGKIGVGKTTGIMFNEIKELIQKEENLLIVDNKEEYYKTFGKELKEKGYNTLIINLKDTTKSNGFNPLLLPYKLYKNGNKDTAIKIINNFSRSIMHNEKAMDPFWTDSAANYLTGLILILFKEGNEEEINLGSVQMMMSLADKNGDKFKEYVNKLDVISPEYTFVSPTALAPLETKGGIVSVLKMELTKYTSTENLLNLLCTNEIDLTNINNKTAIFIISNNEYSKLTSVVISEVINSNNKYTYILDNSDSFGKIIELDDLLENATVDNQKIYMVSRNIENITIKYGKNILDRFENVMNVEVGTSLETVGEFNEHPSLNKNNNSYFNLMNIL
ncbi:MAG: type IV secretory system conjugative DNA transfer family protein [Bacilli bacterium]|nr:type IV secretory system conjugative DNA transfer family protein [Bacilli bacterium]MBO6195737.1 type IV secretory system conjugative DNA transfer family protein [Bacilli bacterium]